MKIIYFLFSIVSGSPIIKNSNIPACRNCIHYKPSFYNNEFTSSYNDCKKFGEKNIITDEITYNYADSSRNDESKCGKEGRYFVEEKNIKFKIFSYKFVSNWPNWLIILSIIFFLRKIPF